MNSKFIIDDLIGEIELNQKYERCTCAYCVGEATRVMKSCVMLRQKEAERKMKEGKRGYERVYKLNEILMEE